MTTINGFDTDQHLIPAVIRRAKQLGLIAAGRYLKNLTADEVAACAAAKFKLWLIDEGMGNRATFQRGEAGGHIDGQKAAIRAKVLGVTANTPIFFAIDYDATVSDVANIRAYLNGCLLYTSDAADE